MLPLEPRANAIEKRRTTLLEKTAPIINKQAEGFKSMADGVENLVKKDQIIYGTFGIHPHEANTNSISKDKIIKNVSGSTKTKIESSSNNQIFSNLLKANKDNYKGNYNIGCFNIEVKQLVDSNLKHLNFKPYNLLLNLEEFKFI